MDQHFYFDIQDIFEYKKRKNPLFHTICSKNADFSMKYITRTAGDIFIKKKL